MPSGGPIKYPNNLTFAQSMNMLAAALTMSTPAIAGWVKRPDAPAKTKFGWNVEEVKEYILSKTDSVRTKRILKGESINNPETDPTKMTWKSRRERAEALRREQDLEKSKDRIFEVEVYDRFVATTITETIGELRRSFESTLPAKLEGQSASRIRTILRTDLDKILHKFENEFNGFHDKAKNLDGSSPME